MVDYKTIAREKSQTAGSSKERTQWLALLITMEKGASEEVTLSTFETLMAESGFKNYANKKVPSSHSIPHDVMGNDGRSVGVMQQQVGVDGSDEFGWGNVHQAMDPNHAISVYVDRAMQSGKKGQGAHQVAQSVQRSAYDGVTVLKNWNGPKPYGSNYQSKQDDAIKLINKMREQCAEQARKGNQQ